MMKQEIIDQYVEKLGLSLAEAEQLYKDEQADNLPTLDLEKSKVASEMARADRKKEKTTRTRTRKVDTVKAKIMDLLFTCLCDNLDTPIVELTNPEREITFLLNGEQYKVTLIRQRKLKLD